MIVVTHYQRLLNYIVPDFVHVLAEGRIVKSGGKELALELEAERLRCPRASTTSRRRSAAMTAVSEQTGSGWSVSTRRRPPKPGCRVCAIRALQCFAGRLPHHA